MTVERKNGGFVCEEERKSKFPKGLRVLAVDDQLPCLRILEQLLRKCEYEVTTTTQAITALKMLRENRSRFDLVISDVEMPDMDGFKLLELVGLEMDLPVIMLSGHSDTNFVMKGISHGACDYLIKPVRLQELKNIWQHVIRKKEFGTKDSKMTSSQDKSRNESGQEVVGTSNANQNDKFINKKRKDQDEDEDEDGDEEDEENESEDPSAQKKPRVVWSVELHQKFVAAVNQLGIDKAVPKKILDLMDSEGLTRENVASHLQKYRLYLKRISSVTSQQANMDASYLRMASLESFRDFRTLTGSSRLSNTPQTSYYPPGMFSRLNTPTGLGLRGISSSASNPILPLSSSLFQGISTLNTDFKPITENSSFAVPSKLGSSSNILLNNVPNNTLMLPRSTQNTQSACGLVGNQFFGSLNPNQNFKTSSSNFLDHGNSCSENWGSASQFSMFRSSSLPLSQPMLNHDLLNHNNLSERTGSSVPDTQFQINPNNFLSNNALSEPHLRAGMQNQAGLIDTVVQNMNYNSNHVLSNNLDTSAGTSLACLGQNSTACTQNMNMNGDLMRQLNGCTSSLVQHNDAIRLDGNSNNKSPEDYLPQMHLQGDNIQNGFESLEDLMNAMIKREENEALILDGDFGFDPNSLGSFETLQPVNFK